LTPVIFGYYDDRLTYLARTKECLHTSFAGQIYKKLVGLETAECPFANLPEPSGGRWGQGLTAAKMNECRWVKPVLMAQFEFAEWTPDNHLRHFRFISLREDKGPREVRRDT
jgi:bifunctional non-homologous end joining protein LigD